MTNQADPALERDIQQVAAATGLLPSVVRACLTAYASDPTPLVRAFDEAAEVVRDKGMASGQDVAAWLRAYGRQL